MYPNGLTTFPVSAGLLSVGLLSALAGCGSKSGDKDPCAGAASGTICTWAGTDEAGYNGDGLPRWKTRLNLVMDVEFAPDGRGYIVDFNNYLIRRVNADDTVEPVLGTRFPGDGPDDMSDLKDPGAPGLTVSLNHPTDIQFTAEGVLTLAAWHNHKIRRWDPTTGLVRVTCGRGPGVSGDGGPAEAALLKQPRGIVIAPNGDVYVADSGNNKIRMIANDATHTINTVVGTGMKGFAGDGGPPLQANLHLQEGADNPEPGGSLALDAAGRLYVSDRHNHRIRVVDFAAGTIDTLAGTGEAGSAGDGGPAAAAQLNLPGDVEIGPDGRLYVADTNNNRIRAIALDARTITTVAGSGEPGYAGDGGPATAAKLQRPFGVGFDAAGNMYVADSINSVIRKVIK